MANTNQPTTAGTDVMDMAIGLSLIDALGGGGEVYGRQNNIFFNNNVDAFGLPRNRFSFLPTGNNDSGLNFGMDMRTILGGNAEVYGRPNSDFSNSMMTMLMTGGIFGLLIGLAQYGAQQQALEARQQAQQPQGGTTPAPAGISAPDEEHPTITGTTLPSTSRTPAVTASASSARAPVTAAAGGQGDVVSTHITVRPGDTAPPAASCEQPKDDVSIARSCTVIRPKAPGG